MIDICTICNTQSNNCTHYDSMVLYDVCLDDFECMTAHNDACAELNDDRDEEQEQKND